MIDPREHFDLKMAKLAADRELAMTKLQLVQQAALSKATLNYIRQIAATIAKHEATLPAAYLDEIKRVVSEAEGELDRILTAPIDAIADRVRAETATGPIH